MLRRSLVVIMGTVAFVALGGAAVWASDDDNADELFFYRDDGLYRYYDVAVDADLGSPILQGDGYTTGWDVIVGVDLDGDSIDELFFYREDGLFRYYNVKANGDLGSPILAGDGYTSGWDSIVALDLDRDGQDEMLFYREDGLFRYYNVKANGDLGSPILEGNDFTLGWDSVVAIDLDGNAKDELFFYREDGLYGYYEVGANGPLGDPIREGSGYTAGWDSISAIDLDGDGHDEVMFYRNDGLYRYYNIGPDADLGSPILAGSGYTTNWSAITAVDLNGELPIEQVSRFTTYFNCCEARVTNIRLMAAEIDGTVVLPGDTFSLDQVAGPRTASKGYVGAGYLLGGEGACCVIGGGVSQFGTTIHNAVFWAGYDVVEHKPHSRWISRYPLGIEATLFYGSLDYKFTNDTPAPVTIRTSSSGTSVTVEIWGNQGGWQMYGWHPRGARNSSIVVTDFGGTDAKRVTAWVGGSAPGPVSITRSLTKNGVRSTQFWSWNYAS